MQRLHLSLLHTFLSITGSLSLFSTFYFCSYSPGVNHPAQFLICICLLPSASLTSTKHKWLVRSTIIGLFKYHKIHLYISISSILLLLSISLSPFFLFSTLHTQFHSHALALSLSRSFFPFSKHSNNFCSVLLIMKILIRRQILFFQNEAIKLVWRLDKESSTLF